VPASRDSWVTEFDLHPGPERLHQAVVVAVSYRAHGRDEPGEPCTAYDVWLAASFERPAAITAFTSSPRGRGRLAYLRGVSTLGGRLTSGPLCSWRSLGLLDTGKCCALRPMTGPRDADGLSLATRRGPSDCATVQSRCSGPPQMATSTRSSGALAKEFAARRGDRHAAIIRGRAGRRPGGGGDCVGAGVV
jgi:hypothetical protein